MITKRILNMRQYINNANFTYINIAKYTPQLIIITLQNQPQNAQLINKKIHVSTLAKGKIAVNVVHLLILKMLNYR